MKDIEGAIEVEQGSEGLRGTCRWARRGEEMVMREVRAATEGKRKGW